jgi:hypothetical protein
MHRITGKVTKYHYLFHWCKQNSNQDSIIIGYTGKGVKSTTLTFSVRNQRKSTKTESTVFVILYANLQHLNIYIQNKGVGFAMRKSPKTVYLITDNDTRKTVPVLNTTVHIIYGTCSSYLRRAFSSSYEETSVSCVGPKCNKVWDLRMYVTLQQNI